MNNQKISNGLILQYFSVFLTSSFVPNGHYYLTVDLPISYLNTDYFVGVSPCLPATAENTGSGFSYLLQKLSSSQIYLATYCTNNNKTQYNITTIFFTIG